MKKTNNIDPTAEAKNAKMSQERKFISNLFEESLNGNGPEVKKLVSEYAKKHKTTCYDVLSQFKDGNKRTALHFACQGLKSSDNVDILSYLLKSTLLSVTCTESLLRLKDNEGLTCLMIAAQHPDLELGYQRVKFILEIGGKKLALARSKSGGTPLHYAAGIGAKRETLKALFAAGNVALNTCSKQGGTPLHWVAGTSPKKEKEDDFAEALVTLIDDCGADVDAPNEQGMPPLILSAAANNDRNSSILIQKGADPTKILPGNVTLFHMAADLNLIKTLTALLHLDETTIQKYKTMKNDQGETPLDLAAAEGHIECVMLLLPDDDNSEASARKYIEMKKTAKKNESNVTVKPSHIDKLQNPQGSGATFTLTERDTEAKMKATRFLELESSQSINAENKDNAIVFKAKGNEYFSKKEYELAIKEYSSAIETYLLGAGFYPNCSACHKSIKKFKAAIDDALLAQHLRPDWSKPHFCLAVCLSEMQKIEDVACSAWKGLQLNQKNDELKALLQKCVKLGKKTHNETLAKKCNAN